MIFPWSKNVSCLLTKLPSINPLPWKNWQITWCVGDWSYQSSNLNTFAGAPQNISGKRIITTSYFGTELESSRRRTTSSIYQGLSIEERDTVIYFHRREGKRNLNDFIKPMGTRNSKSDSTSSTNSSKTASTTGKTIIETKIQILHTVYNKRKQGNLLSSSAYVRNQRSTKTSER